MTDDAIEVRLVFDDGSQESRHWSRAAVLAGDYGPTDALKDPPAFLREPRRTWVHPQDPIIFSALVSDDDRAEALTWLDSLGGERLQGDSDVSAECPEHQSYGERRPAVYQDEDAEHGFATCGRKCKRVEYVRTDEVAELREALEQRQAAIDRACSLMKSSAYVGGPSEREAWRGAMEALGPYETQHIGANPDAGERLQGEGDV
jgi:hypothetical protein